MASMDDRDCYHGQLARSCGLCEVEADIAEMQATIARQREWIEKTGHRPACYARECEVCGYTQGPHEWGVIRMGHKFQPGPCTCGWADLVGG